MTPYRSFEESPHHLARPLVILGAGYTGRFIYQMARRHGRAVFATSRQPSKHLPFAQKDNRLMFELLEEGTWGNIPDQADIIWCFPALPKDRAAAFTKTVVSSGSRLIILGSTSAYPQVEGKWVDETMRVDTTLPRVESEEMLQYSFGAIILRLAGIYGSGRHVLDWIRRGKVTNSNRFANFIHAEDIAGICLAAIGNLSPGESYIVSDGHPRRWSDLCESAQYRWRVPIPPRTSSTSLGKRLSPKKILSATQYSFLHPDLLEALDTIEGESSHG